MTSRCLNKIGTYNARTLGNDDSLLILARQMAENSIDILMITETKRREETFIHAGSYTCYFGTFDKIGGVGFMINNDIAKSVLNVTFNGIRLGRIDLLLDGKRVAIVAAYSPTNDAKYQSEVLKFYANLESLCKSTSSDKLFIGGDFNGRIPVSRKKRGAVDSFTLDDGSTNRNGDLLMQFTETNNLIILNRRFVKRRAKR
uniref:Endo/exonuclease/phosphatase domain-containing protein n=1 Tax=Rhabditophanes sp. KR3021 TaxID=114890 RepID=A0AC35TSP8_9BILA